MATITPTDISGSGSSAVTVTTLTGTDDTFTYVAGSILILRNNTAGALTPVIDGDGASTVGVQGVGNVDISGGYDGIGSMADGSEVAIPLDSIRRYLAGTIAITGGTGLEAVLLTP